MSEWLSIALEPTIVKRAIKYALVVGAVLIAINHGDAILRGDMNADHLFKMALTVLVPYCVSTASSVGVIQQMRRIKPTTSS